MSLYSKPIDQIEFSDVAAFCTATPKPREGLRLDFKADFPKDLRKTLAAFGNTSGGIIIVGVASDASNEPIWPPAGIESSPQNSERVNQGADSVHPPLAVEVSKMFPLETDATKVLFVIRVRESPDAPHAVDQGRRIYERTGDTSSPIELANIDRIALLLRRRGRTEEERERFIEDAINRSRRLIPLQNLRGGFRFASVIPLFPSAQIATMDECYAHHQILNQMGDAPMRGPGGVYSRGQEAIGGGVLRSQYYSTECSGHVFAMEHCSEVHEPLPRFPSEDRYLWSAKTDRIAWRTVERARRLYLESGKYDGLVRLTLGHLDCFGWRMLREIQGRYNDGPPFPDAAYRCESVLHSTELAEVGKAIAPLLSSVDSAFGLPPPDRY